MLGPDYWNAGTSLLFGARLQAPVSTRCSPERSCCTSSWHITSKLYLIPRKGRTQRIVVLPTFRESSPRSRHLQAQEFTIWWTETCPWHDRMTTLRPHTSTIASFSFTVLFIVGVEPWAVDGVMTLSPHDLGTCRHAHD
jgi:hypothetical protein